MILRLLGVRRWLLSGASAVLLGTTRSVTGMSMTRGVSRVWTMSSPPSGTVQFRVLEPILGLHPSVERKRVTLLYRPIDAAVAPSIIDDDVNQATARLTGANPERACCA